MHRLTRVLPLCQSVNRSHFSHTTHDGTMRVTERERTIKSDKFHLIVGWVLVVFIYIYSDMGGEICNIYVCGCNYFYIMCKCSPHLGFDSGFRNKRTRNLRVKCSFVGS